MLGLQELLYLFELCGELFVKVEDCKVEGVLGNISARLKVLKAIFLQGWRCPRQGENGLGRESPGLSFSSPAIWAPTSPSYLQWGSISTDVDFEDKVVLAIWLDYNEAFVVSF